MKARAALQHSGQGEARPRLSAWMHPCMSVYVSACLPSSPTRLHPLRLPTHSCAKRAGKFYIHSVHHAFSRNAASGFKLLVGGTRNDLWKNAWAYLSEGSRFGEGSIEFRRIFLYIKTVMHFIQGAVSVTC